MLITRPHRFGKTMNMNMLKIFLEPDVDINGKFEFVNENGQFDVDIKKIKKNSIWFLGDRKKFRRLKIADTD